LHTCGPALVALLLIRALKPEYRFSNTSLIIINTVCNAENETLIPTSEKVDTILTIVSTLVEDQKDGPTAEKLRFTPLLPFTASRNGKY
jgi:hypothetical protein